LRAPWLKHASCSPSILTSAQLVVLARERSGQGIIFRLANARAAHVIERLADVLTRSADVFTRPAIVLVEEGRHRIRYLPIGQSET
jgi:hypothetical protein